MSEHAAPLTVVKRHIDAENRRDLSLGEVGDGSEGAGQDLAHGRLPFPCGHPEALRATNETEGINPG